MLARSCTRCGARLRLASCRNSVSWAKIQQQRHYTMPSGAPASSSSSGSSSVGMLAPFVSELDQMAPSFDLKGEQIRIIKTPTDFYETLKVRDNLALHAPIREAQS